MKYTIEFELPDNQTIEDEIQGAYVSWAVWGHAGITKAKPVEEPKWILVSKRLPKEKGWYNVTYTKKGEMKSGVAMFFEKFESDVIAWMPLPEPLSEPYGGK